MTTTGTGREDQHRASAAEMTGRQISWWMPDGRVAAAKRGLHRFKASSGLFIDYEGMTVMLQMRNPEIPPEPRDQGCPCSSKNYHHH